MMLRSLAAAALLAALPLDAPAQVISGFSATVSGIEETPPNASTELGNATLTYDMGSGVLTCDVQTTMATVTIAHVHQGAVGVAGPIVFGLNPIAGGWGGSGVLNASQLEALLKGELYVNLHSAAFPGGEIRGQIRAPRHFVSFATGAKETPPNPSPGTADGVFEFDLATLQLSYDVAIENMSPTTAHLHAGFPGSAGGIVVSLDPNGPNAFAGTSPPLSVNETLQLLAGGLYLNVHSAMFPGGEVRDQVWVGGLNQDTNRVGAVNGIDIDMTASIGTDVVNKLYWTFGSVSGTSPGVPIDGLVLPLNVDAYLLSTLTAPNSPPLSPSQGFLSPGQNPVSFAVGPNILNPLIGGTIDHAFVAIDLVALKVDYVSNVQGLSVL